MHTKMLHDMFVLHLPVLEKVLRPMIVYGFLIVGLRLAGKRELAQLNPFDLVVLLILSNTVQNAIIGDDNSVVGGLVGAATLLAINYVVVRFLYSHEKLDRAVEGKSDTLIENGKINMDRLRSELVTMQELEAAARKQGFDSLAEISRAILEPGGAITFTRKEPAADEVRHRELLDRLDEVTRELEALRAGRS